jgi:hypothetical protein
VAGVVVQPEEAAITASETAQLIAVTRDAAGNELTDREVSWSSSNIDVASQDRPNFDPLGNDRFERLVAAK